MASIQSAPQGIDAFSEGLSSFENQEIVTVSEPTAAVQSASNNSVKKVTIVEGPSAGGVAGPVAGESEAESTFADFFEENKNMILVGIMVMGGIYYYKKNKKN